MTSPDSIDQLIQKSISLKAFNTFRFDYEAEYFAIADNLDSLRALLLWGKENDQIVTVIGSGSNLLISGHVSGLVIINRLMGINADTSNSENVTLRVAAGEEWHKLVEYTVYQNWYGIENLALIPGTAGAAPVQNIGAYGVEVKDVLSKVQVIDKQTADVFWIPAEDCGFAYRNSHFKGKWKDNLIITAIELKLKKQAELELSYGGLHSQLKGEATLKSVFELVCEVRESKLPSPAKIANAGSFFKNPIVSQEKHTSLKEQFPELVSFAHGEQYKLAAGWLIDQAGWKGKEYLGVGVYPKQALVLVNYSESSANALLALEEKVKHAVFEKYGVELEREPVELPIPSLRQGD
ncbi:UDP-N-acetylmuramate dehydrogenase [Marinomonas sp. C2222]|uniref:UDP-N-acetylenolpyruvoylglucosamine reductase n=1 Tax=Marinomonas sargassi TaxID=2984494 RepID=A0ABT2YS68_9GAMM|nr:UDP-N-acetylmuramate dehydrogenase [Marinomonas sargassi]MCV2402739.1 UDP-N-acetylmuramate dehydrogenase [Marinomonas sargassi]